jgi:hypothetical protein
MIFSYNCIFVGISKLAMYCHTTIFLLFVASYDSWNHFVNRPVHSPCSASSAYWESTLASIMLFFINQQAIIMTGQA